MTIRPPVRRANLALLLAAAGLLAAAVAAVSPATHLRARYSWPPLALPATQPERIWYTPLLLIRREPESIEARIPCRLPSALPKAPTPITVLATARDPAKTGALAVLRVGRRLLVQVGGRTLAGGDLGGSGPIRPGCAYELSLRPGTWSFTGGPRAVSMSGSLEAQPLVDGLFSGLDLSAASRPSIQVVTAAHGSRATWKQTFCWTAAVLCALAALLLVASEERPTRTVESAARAVRKAMGTAGGADVAVGLVLLGWWVIGPAFYDDGWVVARQQNFSSSRGFSNYYDSLGANLPLAYWLEWAQHWLTQSTSALLVLRLPALLCLSATWVLCRWLLARVLATSPGGGRTALWALACGFCAGALSWGMTLRPEPVTALLVTSVLVCTIRFLERETAAPLAAATVLVALALSAHPAGVVSFAPLIVAAPALASWARARPKGALAIVASGAALLGVLAVVGSDLQLRRADTQTIRTFGDATAGWRDEISRYAMLSSPPYGAPLRRAFVALLLLAVLAYLARSDRRPRAPLLGLPAAAVGASLLLLILTPSKWPWHFGTLIGVGAVALAAETARLHQDARHARRWSARPFLAIGAAMLAAAWSWSPRGAWNDLDLVTLHWTLSIERRFTLSKLAGVAPVAILVVVFLFELVRRRGDRLPQAPWRVATWTVPIVAVPLIAFSATVLAADAAKTSSWTLARQNLKTLRGDVSCGLADDSLVPVRQSMRPLTPIDGPPTGRGRGWLPAPPAPNIPVFAVGPPSGPSRPANSPWFRVAPASRIGFYYGGSPSQSDRLEIEWGRSVGGSTKRLSAEDLPVDFVSDARPSLVPWRFLADGDLPAPPRRANAMRLALRSDAAPGGVIALTSPVTYSDERLSGLLDGRRSLSVVIPNLLTYVPCVRQPRLGAGVVQMPNLIVALRQSIWPLGRGTSPFDSVPEIYRLERLPLADSPHPPGDVAVYVVDQRIPGGRRAPPDSAEVAA